MKKLLFFIGLAVYALHMTAQTSGYVIKGISDGAAEGDTVFLSKAQGYFLIPIDTTTIKDGKFTFTGNQPVCTQRYIQVQHAGKDSKKDFAGFVLENAEINIHVFPSESKRNAEVKGGPNQQLADEFDHIGKKWNSKLEPPFNIYYYKKGTEEEQKIAKAEFDSISGLMHEEQRQFLLSKLPMQYCDMLLASNYSDWNEVQKKEVLDAFAAKCPGMHNYKAIVADETASSRTGIGKKFTDFTMIDPNGKNISLSEIISKNKYTLVDFWASWCGPCRAEMPNVVKAYAEKHSKGFEVIGVSLDNKKDAWVKAITDLNMPWPQMSDLKGWQCAGAAIYNVRAIPANVLISQDGKIIAKDLRGEKLLETLNSLIK